MTELLDSRLELLVRLCAAVAARRDEDTDRIMRQASEDGGATDVEEALLQSYLFLGYPLALNAIARWRELSGEAPPESEDDRHAWRERGERVCSTVYGGQYEDLRANIRRLHPDMERWMVEEGYGKVLGRPGLGLAHRELCIVALLAVLDAPRQLYSHLRGALNAGADEEQVGAALEVALTHADSGAARRARETWEAVRTRGEG